MKKRFALILCSLAMVCWSGMALAATTSVKLDYAFTADNRISSFGLYLGNDLVQDLMGTTSNISTDWQTAKTGSYEGMLTQGETYTLKWGVYNLNNAQPSGGDPMAFLGQFSLNDGTLISSDATSGVWGASSSVSNGIYAYDVLQSGGTWKAGYNSLSPYILGVVNWIGAGRYPGDSSEMLVTASFTAPVPLPGAAILFGSGLLGLVGLRRRQIV